MNRYSNSSASLLLRMACGNTYVLMIGAGEGRTVDVIQKVKCGIIVKHGVIVGVMSAGSSYIAEIIMS